MPVPAKFRSALCLLACGCLWHASTGMAQTVGGSYSLPDCIGYATQNSFTLQLARLDQQIASAYVHEVRSTGLPQVSVSGVFEDNLRLPVSLIPAEVTGGEPGTFTAARFGTKYNLRTTLRADQLLYDGTFWTGLKAAKQSTRYYNELTRQRTETVVYNVSRAYYRALVSAEQLEVVRSNLRNTEELLKITVSLYENGLASQTDRDRVQVDYNNLLADYQNTGREKVKTLNQLKFDMGMPLETVFQLSAIDTTLAGITRGVDTTATAYYTNRPDFQVLQASGELLRLNLRRVRAGYQPTLGAYFSGGVQAQRQDFTLFDAGYPWFKNYLVGLQLNLPLFDGLRKHYQARQGRLNVDKNDIARLQLVQQVSLEVANATEDFSTKVQTLGTQQRNVSLARQVYQSTRLEYQEGTSGYANLVAAETSLQRAQTNYTASLLDVYLAKLDLLKAQGKLLQYLGPQ
jgi:outer membrane protein TolC